MTAEVKDLKMHKKLLLDVIKRQAGTLEKAVLEGLMNSVEAGASRVDVIFKEVDGKAFLSIVDDGQGITTEKEIIEHFETFGTPHEESENKVYAQFRMGRGQMFSFGHNVWKTASFVMEVDINKMGLTYKLLKKQPWVEGCQIDIELYENPIGSWSCRSIESLKERIKSQVEFIDTPIYFNNEKISISPQTLTWTKEDENAYYLFGVGDGVKIYNLGAFVKTVPSYQAGTDGMIVSKKMLAVNFARNDVQSDCAIFSEIQKVIQENKKNNAKKRYKVLTENERKALLIDIRDGSQEYNDIKSVRCFKTTQGKWMSLNMLFKNTQKWSFAVIGNPIADRLMQQEKALCLDENMLYSLNYSGERKMFFQWLLKEYLKFDDKRPYYERYAFNDFIERITPKLQFKAKNYRPFSQEDLDDNDNNNECLSDGFSSDYHILPHKKLLTTEKRIIKALMSYNCFEGRQICIGESGEALAWTDGDSYIALDRNWLRGLNLRRDYCVKELFTTLCHEMAHNNNSEGTHVHGTEFYENYYQVTTSRHYSPLENMTSFKEHMERIKIDEIKEKEQEKKRKKKELRDMKLGIAASSK